MPGPQPSATLTTAGSGFAIGVTFAMELNRMSKHQDHYSLPLEALFSAIAPERLTLLKLVVPKEVYERVLARAALVKRPVAGAKGVTT